MNSTLRNIKNKRINTALGNSRMLQMWHTSIVSVLFGTFFRKHLNRSAIRIFGLAMMRILSSIFCNVDFRWDTAVLVWIGGGVICCLLEDRCVWWCCFCPLLVVVGLGVAVVDRDRTRKSDTDGEWARFCSWIGETVFAVGVLDGCRRFCVL